MRRLERIQIEIPNQVIQQFKKQAREAFPRETLAYLIGRDAGTVVEIESLFIPEGIDSHCTPASVMVNPHWLVDAREHAEESAASVVGTIHSHPYTFEEARGQRLDRGLSEGDHEALRGHGGISGICTVQQAKSGRLSASIRFWGPVIPVVTLVT